MELDFDKLIPAGDDFDCPESLQASWKSPRVRQRRIRAFHQKTAGGDGIRRSRRDLAAKGALWTMYAEIRSVLKLLMDEFGLKERFALLHRESPEEQ